MSDNGKVKPNHTSGKIGNSLPLRIWLFLATLEGVISVSFFLSLPGDSETGFLVGLSKTRLLVLSGLLVTLFIMAYFAFLAWRNRMWATQVSNRVHGALSFKYIYGIAIVILFVGVFLFSQILYLSGVVSDPYVRGFLDRLRPILFWALVLFFQTIVMFPFFRYGIRKRPHLHSTQILRKSGIIFLLFFSVVIFIAFTGIGIIPDVVGWDAPGTPILSIQMGLVWAAGFLFIAIETSSNQRRKGLRFDLIVSLFLWGCAFLLWMQEPLTPDYFAPTPKPPNNEIYPYSDAALHDVNAQELLVGEGFPGISRKPLYVLFLTLLHVIGGQSYINVIGFQVGVLALIPVVIYWLTKDLNLRLAGFIAAGLVILRERNAISLSGDIRVSHSKLMMSDMPAVLAIAILTWLVVLWLKAPNKRKLLPLWIGGVLGLLMLLRPQFGLIIPIVPLMMLLYFRHRHKQGFLNFCLIIIGFLFTLFPWLFRSYRLTGEFTLNDPAQMAFLTEQYHLEPQTESLEINPGESISDFNQRINKYLKNFILKNPSYVTSFIAAHFVHNEIEMIQLLPMSPWIVSNPKSDLFPYWQQNPEKLWMECCSVPAYVFANRFWDPWIEALDMNNFAPILFHLVFLSLGIAVAVQRYHFLGLFPLFISLAYSFSTAIGRYSGWRLILPADWVVLLYYSIGLAQVTLWLYHYYFNLQGNELEDVQGSIIPGEGWDSQNNSRFPWRNFWVSSLILVGLGLIPLIVDAGVPRRYQENINTFSLASEFQSFSTGQMQAFLKNGKAVVVHGRALYPKHYRAKDGEPGENWDAFLVRDYPRLGFYLVGPFKGSVILQLESSPVFFPHASDVIVLGCMTDSYLDAAAVKVWSDEEDSWEIYRDTLENLDCPLGSP